MAGVASDEMMMTRQSKEPINPFYVLAGICGVAFTITACAYGMLMLRSNRAAEFAPAGEHGLMNLLDRHGAAILSGEVALLAIFSIAAIGLDHYRGKKQP